jgi:multidrug efflux pump subunit AcrA (membrane-fusion protein)
MFALCGRQPTNVAPVVPQVRIAQVGGAIVPNTIIATGTVARRRETSLGLTSAGRIAKVTVNEGDSGFGSSHS